MDENLRDYLALSNKGKFAPKLSFAQRCAILYLSTQGADSYKLAETFGIDPRTVGRMVNPDSPRYKDVRDEFSRLGPEEFKAKYYTEAIHDKMQNFSKAFSEAVAKKSRERADKAARTQEGWHRIHRAFDNKEVRIEIRWQEEPGPGWYYRDIDSNWPEMWMLPDNEQPSTTSAEALRNVKKLYAEG